MSKPEKITLEELERLAKEFTQKAVRFDEADDGALVMIAVATPSDDDEDGTVNMNLKAFGNSQGLIDALKAGILQTFDTGKVTQGETTKESLWNDGEEDDDGL